MHTYYMHTNTHYSTYCLQQLQHLLPVVSIAHITYNNYSTYYLQQLQHILPALAIAHITCSSYRTDYLQQQQHQSQQMRRNKLRLQLTFPKSQTERNLLHPLRMCVFSVLQRFTQLEKRKTCKCVAEGIVTRHRLISSQSDKLCTAAIDCRITCRILAVYCGIMMHSVTHIFIVYKTRCNFEQRRNPFSSAETSNYPTVTITYYNNHHNIILSTVSQEVCGGRAQFSPLALKAPQMTAQSTTSRLTPVKMLLNVVDSLTPIARITGRERICVILV